MFLIEQCKYKLLVISGQRSDIRSLAVVWQSHNATTRVEIDRMKREFWETVQVYGGDPVVWQTVRDAIESKSLQQTQEAVRKLDLILIDCSLSNFYDQTGFKYEIPPFCFSYPSNLTNEEPKLIQSKGLPAISNELAAVKLRLSDGKDEVLHLERSSTVRFLKQVVAEKLSVELDKIVIVYMGRGILRDEEDLSNLQYSESTFLQVMVRRR
jgi:hypothetical protein